MEVERADTVGIWLLMEVKFFWSYFMFVHIVII